jgi:copper homeostasis protein
VKATPAEQERAEAGAPYVLEIAANSLASALAAQEGGASRIELCAALELGGLTPSPAQIALARERLSIPVHVLVRPRAGDFAYGDEEHATMLSDVAHCAAVGCDGVVVGALTADGDVDLTRCRELVSAAGRLDLTFHRAIDVCRDPETALEAVIGLGFRRVLSSGGAASAREGSASLRRLIAQAAGRIEIMPGAGIEAGNIAALMAATGAREFHASAKRLLPSRMRFAPPDALGMAGGETRSDAAEVRRLVEALHDAAKRT